MSDELFKNQPERLKRVVHKACQVAINFGVYGHCLFPDCRCSKIPRLVKAVIEEWDALPESSRASVTERQND